VYLCITSSVTDKQENAGHCCRHVTSVNTESSSVSAGTESALSLVSVADHVEHLSDTALGRSVSSVSSFVHCCLSRQPVI